MDIKKNYESLNSAYTAEKEIRLLNVIRKAKGEAVSEFPIYNGKIVKVNSNNTYDVKVDGSYIYRNVKGQDGTHYYKDDFVCIISPLKTTREFVIFGKTNMVVPEETIYEFEWWS